MRLSIYVSPSLSSRPTRARGLKCKKTYRPRLIFSVAPHAGAWIEISVGRLNASLRAVAPHAGAWIEIADTTMVETWEKSRPTRARGLKLQTGNGLASFFCLEDFIELFAVRERAAAVGSLGNILQLDASGDDDGLLNGDLPRLEVYVLPCERAAFAEACTRMI